MAQYRHRFLISLLTFLIFSGLLGCKEGHKEADSKGLPDLNAQMRPYITIENTKLRAGPGPQFRAIGEIGRDATVQVVGRDGDWVLIVSRKGNAPGYIEMTSIEASSGAHYPVVAEIKKGTKLDVVDQEKGWLKVESRRGNKPGYVEATIAKPVASE